MESFVTHFCSTMAQPANLTRFTAFIHYKGTALSNCWGFVDGTVRPVTRPGKDQQILYNGQKKAHSIKFKIVATQSGLDANLFNPMEGKRHNSSMLPESGLLTQLQQHSWSPNQSSDVLQHPQNRPTGDRWLKF